MDDPLPDMEAFIDQYRSIAYSYKGYLEQGMIEFEMSILVALVLLPPTILMGGTLPLICRQFAARPGHVAGSVAWLYALNTLGAAAGCALAGFVLLYLGLA